MEFIRTFREMFNSPENVIDNFVLGEETRFQHPLFYGLMAVTILIILNSVLVSFNVDLQAGLAATGGDQTSQLKHWIEHAQVRVSTQFLPLTMFLLLIPSLCLPGLFFFREDIDGFYYNLILNSYAIGTSVVALLLLIPIWMMDPPSVIDPVLGGFLPIILVGVLVLFIYKQYFLIDDIRGWIRILSSYITGCLIFLLLKSFSAGIIGYFIFAVNRFLDIWMRV